MIAARIIARAILIATSAVIMVLLAGFLIATSGDRPVPLPGTTGVVG